MLAEPRRKQKLSSDPRGLNWSNDEGKFGQKMLERMGWQKGKGLGAQEHGRTEHVKVTLKSDTRGVGCSKSYADDWIAHQDEFNSLLSQLNSTEGVEDNSHPSSTEGDDNKSQVISLEKKSKESKGRLHYQKFTRGKDLSSAKGNDLDCIFGRRKSLPSTPLAQSEAGSDAESVSSNTAEASDDKMGKTEMAHGVTTISTGTSVADYFAKKMAEMKSKYAGMGSGFFNKSETKDLSQDAQETESDPNATTQMNDNSVISDEDDHEKTRKKRKKAIEANEADKDQNTEDHATVDDIKKSKKMKKKKKKRKRETIEPDSTDETITENSEAEKIKSQKTKQKRNIDDKYVTGIENKDDCDSSSKSHLAKVDSDAEIDEPLRKKRKKKKKDKRNTEIECTSCVTDNEATTEIEPATSVDAESISKNKILEHNKNDQKDVTKLKRQSKKKRKQYSKKKIADAFPGTNLDSIKGYGGGHDIGYENRQTIIK